MARRLLPSPIANRCLIGMATETDEAYRRRSGRTRLNVGTLGVLIVTAMALGGCGSAAPQTTSTAPATASPRSIAVESATPGTTPLPSGLKSAETAAVDWAQLASRALTIPPLDSDGVCPTSPRETVTAPALNNFAQTPAWGRDPFFVIPGKGATGLAVLMGDDRMQLWVSNAYHGAMLIRAKRIDSPSPLVFGDVLTQSGTTDSWYSQSGPPKVVSVDMGIPRTGSATIGGNLVPTWDRLQLPDGTGLRPGSRSPQLEGVGWRLFSFLQSPDGPGCYGYQVDIPAGTRLLVVQVPK